MDINQASASDLENAFQVDGVRSRYVIDERNKLGGFESWDQVKQVPGFEDKMIENLQAAGLTLGARREKASGRDGAQSGASERSGSKNLNTAVAEDLDGVPQLDGERARYLIEARNRVGGFKSWEDVKREASSFEDGMVERLQEAGFTIAR